MAMRVRGEQHTTRFQGGVQFQQHARQLLAGYMKERRGDFFQVLRSQYDGLLASHRLSAAGATVAGYSGRISNCSRRWAMRSAISASAGLAARAKMNPR